MRIDYTATQRSETNYGSVAFLDFYHEHGEDRKRAEKGGMHAALREPPTAPQRNVNQRSWVERDERKIQKDRYDAL